MTEPKIKVDYSSHIVSANIVIVILAVMSQAFFIITACTDPGIIPRETDPNL